MPLDQPTTDLRPNVIWNVEGKNLKRGVAGELLRQAEIRQEAIFRAALGMDQRAAVLSAAFAAAAGAIAAAALTLYGTASEAPRGLYVAAFVAGAFLAIASGVCAVATRPQDFYFPGASPVRLASIEGFPNDLPLDEVHLSSAAILEDRMRSNEARQQRNGRFLLAGMLTAAAAPPAAMLIALVGALIS